MTPDEPKAPTTFEDFDDMGYGIGASEIERGAFQQVRSDSDRAVGVVAGSIVERRLMDAIRAQMRPDRATTKRLFNPDGPLGAFGPKIDLAYMLGMLSDSAATDLRLIKSIRNTFAHSLESSSFQEHEIADRCSRISIVDRHTGPVVPNESRNGFVAPARPHVPYFAFGDHASLIKQPRFRYVTAAKVISYILGQGSLNPRMEQPFV